jgi:hypothetical protein
MPTCARGFAGTVVILVELRSLATDQAAKFDRGSRVLVHSPVLPSARNHVSGGAPLRRTRSNLKLL